MVIATLEGWRGSEGNGVELRFGRGHAADDRGYGGGSADPSHAAVKQDSPDHWLVTATF